MNLQILYFGLVRVMKSFRSFSLQILFIKEIKILYKCILIYFIIKLIVLLCNKKKKIKNKRETSNALYKHIYQYQ